MGKILNTGRSSIEFPVPSLGRTVNLGAGKHIIHNASVDDLRMFKSIRKYGIIYEELKTVQETKNPVDGVADDKTDNSEEKDNKVSDETGEVKDDFINPPEETDDAGDSTDHTEESEVKYERKDLEKMNAAQLREIMEKLGKDYEGLSKKQMMQEILGE